MFEMVRAGPAVLRQREIAIRMALGATPRAVVQLLLARGIALAGIGLLAGLLVSLATVRVLSGLLFGVSATDPATFAAVAALALGSDRACRLPACEARRPPGPTARPAKRIAHQDERFVRA
jgi:putative ABC transport system permease protein